MLAGKRICLVTNGHIASNPRLVKEADALVGVGATVTVVAAQTLSRLKAFDEDVLARRDWKLVTVNASRDAGSGHYVAQIMRRRLASALPQRSWSVPGVAEAAWSRITSSIGKAATAIEADLYIAHNLAALPAAAKAARRHRARLGFDAEDLHSEELPDTPANRKLRALARRIEDRYVPQCDYVTASSPMIGAAYSERYGCSAVAVLNVFPLSARAPQQLERGKEPSLYWFSQTIGKGRGLEFFLTAMRDMRCRATLELRGAWAPGYESVLMDLARRARVADRLRIQAAAPPDDMVRLAAAHHAGLSVEPTETKNRELCLGNKIFTYLLAGLPVILSDTPAQRELAKSLGEAALVVALADPPAVARALDEWLTDESRLRAARAAARQAADATFNWDVEKAKFLAAVKGVL